jgi:AcrR family transcriptional regulator
MSSERPRNPERTAARREQILDAAYQVFASKGYATATIADVAQSLRLGHGTIYRYFDNKLDLFMAVIARILAQLAGALTGEGPQSSNTLQEYREQVVRIGNRLADMLDTDPAVAKLLFYEAMGISAELDEHIQAAFEAAGRITELFLHNGKSKGFLRQDMDVEATSLAMNALMFEAGRRIVRSTDHERARERWVQAIVAMIFGGISGP